MQFDSANRKHQLATNSRNKILIHVFLVISLLLTSVCGLSNVTHAIHLEDLLAARCTRQLRDCVEKLRASGNDVTFPVNNCSVTDIEGTVLDISNVLLLTNAASPVARPHLSACLLWLPLATAVSATLFGSQFTLF